MNELPSTCTPTSTPRGASIGLEVKKWLNHGRESTQGAIAQLGERWLCKPEVAGSSPAGSIKKAKPHNGFPLWGSVLSDGVCPKCARESVSQPLPPRSGWSPGRAPGRPASRPFRPSIRH